MSPGTLKAAAAALGRVAREQAQPFTVVLHGGEPLLLGATNLGFAISTLREALPAECHISIQTNGTLIRQEILDLCAGASVSLSVSLDGPRQVHDRNRVGFAGEVTFDKVLDGVRQLQAHPHSELIFAGLLAVVDPESNPVEVYSFFKGLRPPSVDFIYKDGNHSRLPKGKAAAWTTEYGQWMAALLDVYLSDDSPIRIRVLDDMIKLVLGGSGLKEGVGVTNYGILVIDTDGSVMKNDTLKSSFDGADRFSAGWSVGTHCLVEIINSPEFAEYLATQRPSNATCLACPELRICGGGMTLHRWRDGSGYDNPAVYCDDQKLLIRHIREKVVALGAIP